MNHRRVIERIVWVNRSVMSRISLLSFLDELVFLNDSLIKTAPCRHLLTCLCSLQRLGKQYYYIEVRNNVINNDFLIILFIFITVLYLCLGLSSRWHVYRNVTVTVMQKKKTISVHVVGNVKECNHVPLCQCITKMYNTF